MKFKQPLIVFIFWCLQSNFIQPLKILFYTHAFPEFIQPFVLNQITGLIKLGHDITILAPKKTSYGADFTELSDVPQELHDDIIKYKLLDKTYYKQLPESKKKFDVILCQQGTFGENMLKERKKYNIKGQIITFLRGKDITARLKENPVRYKQLYKDGAFFLPVCDYFRKLLIKNKCNSNKIYVLYAGIDCKKFKFKERYVQENESIKIVTTGRLVEKKGIEYAIKAVHQLLQKNKNIEFIIIGGGPIEKRLKRLIQDLQIEKSVRLVGWKTQEEVVKILDKSHIFILPAVTGDDGDQEGISNALKEAMAMGLPVISTYHSGQSELIIDGVSGFLVPEKNVNKLAAKLNYLIDHQNIWRDFVHAARQKIEKDFDMNVQNIKLAKICEYVAAGQINRLHREFGIQ